MAVCRVENNLLSAVRTELVKRGAEYKLATNTSAIVRAALLTMLLQLRSPSTADEVVAAVGLVADSAKETSGTS